MNPRASLDVAEEVCRLLQEGGDDVLLIGALALAAHGYVRETRDIDPDVDLDALRAVCEGYGLGGELDEVLTRP